MARTSGDEIVLLTAIPATIRHSSLASMMPAGLALPPAMTHTFEDAARLRLDEISKQVAAAGVQVKSEVRAGVAVDVIVKMAEEIGAREIVLGHRSFERDQEGVGPNAAAIVERAKVRVTLVP